uniref:Cytochrome P450 n=1 Tax=Moniliophthora roreri TaxID=221103 RepID=A0A0W0EXE4_MONRR
MTWLASLDRASLAICGFLALLTLKYVDAYRARSKLNAIPTIGHNGIFSSYYTVWRFLFHGLEIIEEGCRKYPNRAFKFATMDKWVVVVNGPKLVDDIRRAPEDVLSNLEALDDALKAIYTIHPKLDTNPYHIDIIRTPLTRNIGARFADIRDEIIAAFNDNIPIKENEWVEIPAVKAVLNIVVRTSNRVFVGLPLCRDPDYCDLNINFTLSVGINAALIGLFPKFLHPIVGRIFTQRKQYLRRAMKHLGPIIEERLKMHQEYGKEWPDKPNDYISWAIDVMEGVAEDWQYGSVEDLTVRVLGANFAAIHSTSMALTHALYHLAANPHLAGPLREEAETIIKREGWTKNAMVQMRLIDSFLKESQRHVGLGPIGLPRVVKKDFKFSDGSVIPAGTHVGAAVYYAHHNEASLTIYPAADDFSATRFSDLRDQEGEGLKHHMVTPTPDWLNFGIGKHACPGRFFVVVELKAMLAHVLINYDVKFKDGAGFPPSVCIAGTISPNRGAKVMFRKRAV